MLEIHLADHIDGSKRRKFTSVNPRTVGHLTVSLVQPDRIAGQTSPEYHAFVSTHLPCLAEIDLGSVGGDTCLINDASAERLIGEGLAMMSDKAEGDRVAVLHGFSDSKHNGMMATAQLPKAV